jgi:hypothetical protein
MLDEKKRGDYTIGKKQEEMAWKRAKSRKNGGFI